MANNHLEILPIINICIESPTHSIVDTALRSLPVVLPVLDFSTIKNELFPVIASVFSKTSSLGIKVRGLEAFVILCGGSDEPESSSDGLDGIMGNGMKKKSVSSALDKYTMQEKVLPLVKAIKTKEPAVMLAALKVLKQIGSVADTEFIAMDILPILWSMSLGPLLDLKQFQSFMELIKSLSGRVEQEHAKKLQELSSSAKSTAKNDDFMSFGGVAGFPSSNDGADNSEDDFERLVQGKATSNGGSSNNPMDADWDAAPNRPSSTVIPIATFSWSSPSPATLGSSQAPASLRSQQIPSRTITPDLSRFDTLAPSATQFSQPLQPTTSSQFPQPLQPTISTQFSQTLQPTASSQYPQPLQPMTNYNVSAPLQPQPRSSSQSTTVNWSMPVNNAWQSASTTLSNNLASSMSTNQQQQPVISNLSSFSLPPPPSSLNNFQIPPPAPLQRSNMANTLGSFHQQSNSVQSLYGVSQQNKLPAQKSGLDAYESLL
jgi:SCY1-like protein 2